jgi:class 3 adenylate cyclase
MQAFPAGVAEAMLAGRAPEPVSRECVSVFFSDVVGFTTLSSRMEAGRVSRMLGRLFARMDALAAEHGVQKVDVIGDAYLAATNFLEEQVTPGPASPSPRSEREKEKQGEA